MAKKNITAGATSPVHPVRNVDPNQRLRLFVAAGGMCEFPSCREQLLKHHLTHENVLLGEVAHIVGFKKDGPRGRHQERPLDINTDDNLMLLCQPCHSLIDRHPERYTVEQLRDFKREHEASLTEVLNSAAKGSHRTKVVVLTAPIGGTQARIPEEHILQAIKPLVRVGDQWTLNLNDLSQLSESETIAAGKEKIARNLAVLQANGNAAIDHYSIFALGPIPLLIFLGAELDRNVPCHVYNRQHDRDDWTWQIGAPQHEFEWSEIQRAANASEVALMVHTSGTNRREDLPSHIDSSFPVYEIRPIGVAASKNIVRNLETIAAFRRCYEDIRRHIRDQHPKTTTIHLFPAVSPAIAVTIGRELIRKIDPSIRVYDWNKKSGGFQIALEVN